MNASFVSQRYTFYKDCYIVRPLLSEGTRKRGLTDSLRLLCLFGEMLKENNARSSTGSVKTGDKGHLLFEGMALHKSSIALCRRTLFQPFKQAAKMENSLNDQNV